MTTSLQPQLEQAPTERWKVSARHLKSGVVYGVCVVVGAVSAEDALACARRRGYIIFNEFFTVVAERVEVVGA